MKLCKEFCELLGIGALGLFGCTESVNGSSGL